MPRSTSPQGRITRGTTGVNRLRRVDRWVAQLPAFRTADAPLVVDLGYGAHPERVPTFTPAGWVRVQDI